MMKYKLLPDNPFFFRTVKSIKELKILLFLAGSVVLFLVAWGIFFKSCIVYDSTSQTNEGYLYNHVYLVKAYGQYVSPGVLFRIKRFYVHRENGNRVFAEIINGPSPGMEICVNDFGRYPGYEAPFQYPAGRTHPCWKKIYRHDFYLDPDAVEDLGELTEAELKEKGLWIEPFTDEAKVLLKPLPEGVNLEQLKKVAEEGDVDAHIQLGRIYCEGAGVERKDRSKAEFWFRKAAEQGSRDAEFDLAVMLADDRYGESFRTAEKIFRKYAEHGDKDAQFCLGLLLERGYEDEKYSSPKDPERMTKWKESLLWYRKAADLGDARAMRALGMAYSEPSAWWVGFMTRVDEDFEIAAEWFRKAAELGDFAAQRNIGYLYLKGKGVKKDKAEARKWLEKAAAQGDSYAQELLAESFPDSEK